MKSHYTSSSAAAAAKLLQSCPTLCNPRDGNPLGTSVPGILQARILEWVAISFSSAWKWKVKVKLLSHARLLATPWTGAYQTPLSMGFSRQEYWSGVRLPSLTSSSKFPQSALLFSIAQPTTFPPPCCEGYLCVTCYDGRPQIVILCWSQINPFFAGKITGSLYVLDQYY